VDAAEGGLRAGRLQVDSRASVGVCVQELLVGRPVQKNRLRNGSQRGRRSRLTHLSSLQPPLPVCALPMQACVCCMRQTRLVAPMRWGRGNRHVAHACKHAHATFGTRHPRLVAPLCFRTRRHLTQAMSNNIHAPWGGRGQSLALQGGGAVMAQNLRRAPNWAARPACMVHHLPPQHPRYKVQE